MPVVRIGDCPSDGGEENMENEKMASAGLVRMGVPWPEFNDGVVYEDVVKSSNFSSSCLLLDFYSSNYKDSASKEGWLQRIRNKQIHVDGDVCTSPDTMLRIGAHLVYHRLPWKEPFAPYAIDILFEDEHLLAINKPSGLQVLPGGAFQQRTVLTQVEWYTSKSLLSSQRSNLCSSINEHVTPVHRLGRGTSGILLCAKSSQAKSKLAIGFASDTVVTVGQRSLLTNQTKETKRHISKRYRVLAQGLMEIDEVLINQPIGKVYYPGVSGGLHMATSKGRPSQSMVKVLSYDKQNDATLVEVQIFSGRPHQIRVHLASIGHPLVGDPLYTVGGVPKSTEAALNSLHHEPCAEDGGYHKSGSPLPGDCGYHLHSYQLEFDHPFTGKRMEITAPPPLALLTEQERQQNKATFSKFSSREVFKFIGDHHEHSLEAFQN